jgi:hypothetical protein
MSFSIRVSVTRLAVPLDRAAGRRTARFALAAMCAAAVTACSDTTAPAAPAFDTHAAVHPASTDIQFGDFALHLPANVNHVRGILLALGGPDTRGFAIGTPFGAPPPTEAALQDLGAMFRDLAAERGLAIIGSRRFGPGAYPNTPASDQLLLAGIAEAASLTGRTDLLDAPILVYGISGGTPQATGFTQRNPERIAGLFLKVPVTAGPLSGRALQVPAYVVLAELDAFVNNAMLRATFESHRAAGAPWAMALERGVPHHSLSESQRELTVAWMRAILPLTNAGAFRRNPPRVGWLGDPSTGEIASVAAFAGDRSAASWFPTRPLALQWAAFTAP